MVKCYQWTKGDKQGQVVKSIGESFFEDNIEYLVFLDGSLVNRALINDFLIEIPSEQEAMFITDIAPTPLKRVENKPASPAKPQQSPLERLLADSKKSTQSYTITIDIDVPSADLMRILAESYEDGEEQILKFLSSSVNLDAVNQRIAEQIKEKIFGQK